MDFKDIIKQLSERVAKMKSQILTEEATKTAFVMPFLTALGYDVFNPTEVVPEFIADIGIKKGEKVDYAIMKDSKPIILIECKHWSADLNPHNSQLFRYYHTTEAKFGILTNGIHYRFYTDLTAPNKMDEKPFFEFKIDEIRDNQVEKLKEFHKHLFNLQSINNTASELKYLNEIRVMLCNDITEPSDEFIKYFAKNIYPSAVTSKILEQFRGLVKKSYQQYINDAITDKLNAIIEKNNAEQRERDEAFRQANEPQRIVTTQEEFDAFYIIRAILRIKIPISRIHYRDAQSYFSVLLDDNNRKPICRIYLSDKKKQIGLFDSQNETKQDLNSIDDIYQLSDRIINTAIKYDNQKISSDNL